MSSSSSANSTSLTSIGSTTSSCSSSLEDIQHLLYLEALKRFKDDDLNIRRQVDEKMRQYQEAKNEYLHWYAKYVNLMKLCLTRNALEQGSLDDSHVELTKKNIESITEKVSTSNMIDYINPDTLSLLKEMLARSKNYENLEELQKQVAENKAAVRNIQTTTETVEATVESSIVQGFDYFLSEIQMENFAK